MNKLPQLYKYNNLSKEQPIHITSEAQTATAFDTQSHLPDCFNEHHAARSVVTLFTKWVRTADKTDNGMIVVNRQRQRYNATTVDRAVKWLTSHHLLFLTERGGGRGNGNRYFIRWSFIHETLSARQNAVNHSEYAKTLHLHKYARVEALEALEEKTYKQKHSLDKSKTSTDVSRMGNSKREALAKANSQRRQLRSEKAVRWAMAQLRKVSDDPDALAASAKAIRRALRTGDVFIGPEFNRFVGSLADDLESLNDAWPEDRRGVFSFIGFGAWSVALRIYGDRRNAAEYQQRERERREAIRDPLPTEFSCRSENGVATPSARRRVAKEGTVVRSATREQRQSGEAYQQPGNQYRANARLEHPASVYESEPVNLADMMGPYLEKLGRGGGVDEVEGNATDERTR